MRLFLSKLSLIIIFVGFYCLAGQNTWANPAAHRLALIVGNGDYQQSFLKNPVNDARDFASSLRRLGFEVILKTNVSMREFDQLIDQFGRRLEITQGVGLFFYAGHGVQFRGRNYLIPVSADIDRETDLKYKTIDAQRIIDEMAFAKNPLNIVILDACRDNPLTRSFRSAKRGLARFDNTPSGLLLAYSTAPGKQAADGAGRNSPYTAQLLKSVKKENLPLEMVFKDVIKNVKRATRGQQIPWVSSSVDGDFYFSRKLETVADSSQKRTPAVSPVMQTSSPSQPSFELVFWQSISTHPSKEKYEAYLDQYPNGHFRSIAESELHQMKNKTNRAGSRRRSNEPRMTLSTCENHLINRRLTSGSQGNAFTCYRKILSRDPKNPDALAGISKIEDIYIAWAESAIKQNKYNKARIYTTKIKMINPANDILHELEQQLGGLTLASSASRTIGSRNASPVLANIRHQFHSAIRDKDVILAESLLAQVRSTFPNSTIYKNLEIEFKELQLQQESAKLYEGLVLDALESDDLDRAEHYLKKIEDMAQSDALYLRLKKEYTQKVERNKKVHLVLKANVDGNMVLINGVEQGSTPLDLMIIKGDYLIELKKRGYPSHRLQLALYGDSTQEIILSGGFATGLAMDKPLLGIEMVAIEAGCFTMGSRSKEAGRSRDEQIHQECIRKPFWIGKYEVTQQQWQQIMQRNPAYFDECGGNCPIENIEFYEIQYFLQRLNNKTGKKYRLPTEAEWEFAARAGSQTPFSFGECLSSKLANVSTNYRYGKCPKEKTKTKSTVAVGSYPGNAWNIHDMHGNVSEWTCSAYNYQYDGTQKKCYKPKDEIIPGSADTVEKLTVRGGSWQYKASYARAAARDDEYPNANNKRMGFRLVREK